MLTLSDDLRIKYDLGNSYIGQNITYEVRLNANMQSKLIYTGQIYYMKPSYLYFKDIVTPYVVDYKWLEDPDSELNNSSNIFKAIDTFTVTINFSTGRSYTSETIKNATTIPTVSIPHIPSIFPDFKEDSGFLFAINARDNLGEIMFSAYPRPAISGTNSLTIPTGYIRTFTAEQLYEQEITPERFDTTQTSYLLNTDGTTSSDFEVIAYYDRENCSRFFLMWITRDNGFLCRPFCKKSTLTESVDTQFITTLDDRQVPYLKSSNFQWELNSNWLTYDEHNAYEALLVSPIVYLYDHETGQRHRVTVTNSEWIERNSQNNKKPFNLTVTVQLDHKENITY